MDIAPAGYGDAPGPLAIAHRGGAALAPENTIAAFARAYALGYRYLETDVRCSADGVPMAFHDRTLDRVTDGRGPVGAWPLAELRRLRVHGGEPIPTLAEALDAFPDARFTIDLKDEPAIGPLADILRRTGAAARVCVAGAWDRHLDDLRARVGAGLTTALGWRQLSILVTCARTRVRLPLRRYSGTFAHVPLRVGRLPVFGEELIARAHRIGIRVIVWTVDDSAQMAALLDAGVDGIITDRPDLLREVLLARGQWTAPSPTVSDRLS